MLLFNRCICVFLFFSLCFYCFYFLSMYLFSLWATIFNKLMFMFNAPVNYFVTATAGEVLFLVAFARVSLLDGAARCKRRRRLMFFLCAFCFFLNFLSDCSATDGRIFTKSLPTNVFAVFSLMVVLPWKLPPPKKKMDAQSVHFWSENSDSAVFERPLRGNEEELCETKQLV